jgi:hypothetical protein
MDITGAILLAVIGVVIGFLLGALMFSLRKESSSKVASRKLLLSDEQEQLRVWRVKKGASLVIEIEGATYRRESDLNADQSRRLTRLINELRAFMGVPSMPPASSPAAQIGSVKPAATQPAEEQERDSLNPFQIFTRSLQPQKKSGADDLEKSIVAQIDEILQSRLEGTSLADRGIQLLEGPDQGMIVEVGLNRYADIDSIPEEGIRDHIRQAVREWERHTQD